MPEWNNASGGIANAVNDEELMKALFFGPARQQLLGVYHAPAAGRDRFQGVVMCYPFGQEYMRAHRAFRQLALILSSKGYHVFRFDYRGTGDSAGDGQGLCANDWLHDIEAAVQELKDMTGVPGVTLVGLRMGALLAGVVACRRRDINSLVLWDPLITGAAFLAELHDLLNRAPARKRMSNFVEADGSLHINGFCLPPAMQQSLAALSLLEAPLSTRRTLQLTSHETDDFRRLAEHWQGARGFDYRHVPAEHNWNYVDHVGGILLPQRVLKEIGDWL